MTTPTPPSDLIAEMARAICDAWVSEEEANGSIVTPWDKLTEEYKPEFRAFAQAAYAVVRERIEELSDTLDTERYRVAIGVQAVRKALDGRRWLSETGRGSYTYDDERYQQEFGAAIDEIDAALKSLREIAADWTDCPTDPLRVSANRRSALKQRIDP